MSSPPFTEGQLRFYMRQQDVRTYQLGDSEDEVLKQVLLARDSLNSPTYSLGLNKPFLKGQELVFEPARLEDKLFLRYLNGRLRRFYKITPPNRNAIVRQLSVILKSDAYLNFVRADIKRFFRTINFRWLIERLRMDGFLSALELNTIIQIEHFSSKFHALGIPWGLSISSTLAEIFLLEFDEKLRETKQVYYYRRFVDDMILVASENAQNILDRITEVLESQSLKLNKIKTIAVSESHTVPIKLDYLGYQFTRALQKSKKPADVTISISKSKCERLRQRIIESFSDFYKNGDWFLLRDRIKSLTGNYTINKSAHSSPIRTGIFYNYSEITTAKTQLAEIDEFLRLRFVRLRAFLNRRGRVRQAQQIKSLMKYSFVIGWEKRILHRFSQLRLQQISTAWSE
ncbi:antiviral reverse transcriptase Drt3a [Prosthecobacter vanneervenii]|uniref:Reverse transcriptase domain-containing protein n=1 Tax=Prosthecobacter vanneervenii TaxID=48466 RepID=A0A7W8DKN4_9BACT|nr:antiviral reverse transcriptase Drt3a [Prosthecobacter vanneervenii]MBB5033439.1 hypothetical protein [Prosthecobacter vanneervenii]